MATTRLLTTSRSRPHSDPHRTDLHRARRAKVTRPLATALRVVVAALVAALVGGATLAATALPAQAQEGYRYWGYYQHDGDSWAFAQTGPAEATPEDGALEGWRFAVTATDEQRPPRSGEIAFDDVCAGTEAGEGEKRIAVLIDYGTPEDAPDGAAPPEPRGECAVVPEDANGQQVLESVADVRLGEGLTCGIDGYPASGCSDTVAEADTPDSEETVEFTLPEDDTQPADDSADEAAADSGDGAPWGLIAIAAVVVVLAVGAFLLTRRRA